MKNIFTIDTEDWYHANYEKDLFSANKQYKSTVEANVDVYLELFAQNHVKATFFVLGSVAEQHLDMVKKIAREGHEIASHGYGHQLVYNQNEKEFKEDVYRSKVILEDCIGQEVIGYRAPSWSITEQSLWALDILAELGFLYHSSIFPTKNFLYGIEYAPRFIHEATVYGKRNLSLVTIPPSTYRMKNINIPFSGGAYFRLLPECVIERFTDHVNNSEVQPVIFYLHPREIDINQPRLELGLRDSIIHYYGIKRCKKKLIKILNKYDFETMKDFFQHQKFD